MSFDGLTKYSASSVSLNNLHQLHSGNTAALHASYVVAFKLTRVKKPFIDGNLIGTCTVKMAKSFGNDKIAEQFNSVPLSIQTIQRRTTDIGEQLNKSLDEQARKCAYFSLS